MALCDSFLTQDIAAQCFQPTLNPKNKAWAFNYDDVENLDGTPIAGNKVEPFEMKDSKRGYSVEQIGRKPFAGTNTALVVGTYASTFTHQVKLFVPYSVDGVGTIDEIANSKLVVVLDNGTELKNVYGAENGLYCTECTRTEYDDESAGGWIITLEETKSKHSGLHYEATNEELDELCKVTA
jgi:hypothetical protein